MVEQTSNETCDLFVYGTLTFDRVLQALLGHVPSKEKIEIDNFYARTIHLDGWEDFPVLLAEKGNKVPGYVLKDLNAQDLARLDRYEFTDIGYYKRVLLQDNIYYYQPDKNLFAVGTLGEVWNMTEVDASLEGVYAEKVVPDFIAENMDLFGR